MNEEEYENIMKTGNYEYHCPECIEQSLFAIKIKDKKTYIQFKCRLNHMGEILIEDFFNSQKNSIKEMACQYCEGLINNNYCFVCKKCFCSEDNCKKKHTEEQRNAVPKAIPKIFPISDYNFVCPIHFQNFKNYCLKEKILLCEKCPNKYFKTGQLNIDNNLIEEIETNINKIEKQRNDIVIIITDFIKNINNKFKQFKKQTILQIKFAKNLLNSYKKLNDNNSLNNEIILNLKNLKLKELELNSDILSFLNDENNIIETKEELDLK